MGWGLARLIRAWWNVDRIRVPASQGEWLRIEPGAIIERDGIFFDVIEVAGTGSSLEPLVEVRCAAGDRSVRLLVATGPLPDQPILTWEEAETSEAIHHALLTLWPSRRKPSGRPSPDQID